MTAFRGAVIAFFSVFFLAVAALGIFTMFRSSLSRFFALVIAFGAFDGRFLAEQAVEHTCEIQSGARSD